MLEAAKARIVTVDALRTGYSDESNAKRVVAQVWLIAISFQF